MVVCRSVNVYLLDEKSLTHFVNTHRRIVCEMIISMHIKCLLIPLCNQTFYIMKQDYNLDLTPALSSEKCLITLDPHDTAVAVYTHLLLI